MVSQQSVQSSIWYNLELKNTFAVTEMVKVNVRNSETGNIVPMHAVTVADLYPLVQQSRHFGPGTLENADQHPVAGALNLEENAYFTWHPSGARILLPYVRIHINIL